MRIFSIDDFVEGRIPKKEDFRPAIDEFEQACVLPYLGTEVYGALLYGSANRDDFTLASDIDYLMVVQTKHIEEKIRTAAAHALQQRNVLIQVRVIPFEDAQNGLHGIDKGFYEHLKRSADRYRFRGAHPLEVLAEDGIERNQALRMTSVRYSKKLRNRYVNPHASDSEYLEFLKIILEKPWHSLRAALQYKEVLGKGDSKTELLDAYEKAGFPKQLTEDIMFLREVGREYVALLDRRQTEQRDTDHWRKAYHNICDVIEEAYGTAISFIDGNKRLMK